MWASVVSNICCLWSWHRWKALMLSRVRPHEILASAHSDSFYFSLLCVLFRCEEHIRVKVKPSDSAKFPNTSGRTSTRFFISSECFEAPRCEGPNLDASTNEQRKRLIASDWQAMRLPQWLLFGFLWKSNSSSELNDSKRAYYHKGVHVSGAIDYLWIDRTVWVKHSTSVLKIKYRASMFFTYSSVIYFVLCFSLHLVHVVFHSFNNTIMEFFPPSFFPRVVSGTAVLNAVLRLVKWPNVDKYTMSIHGSFFSPHPLECAVPFQQNPL